MTGAQGRWRYWKRLTDADNAKRLNGRPHYCLLPNSDGRKSNELSI